MLLKSVRIRNFKCIKDSGEFSIDKRVTCLVGKNESGKTAILQAIAKINAAREDDQVLNEMRDYPRHEHNEYEELGPTRTADFLETVWLLDEGDHEQLEDVIGPAARDIGEVRFVRRHGEEGLTPRVSVSEQRVVEHLVSRAELEELERKALDGAGTVAELKARLEGIEEPTKRQRELLTRTQEIEDGDCKAFIASVLEARMPKIAYFPEYLRMPGQISVQDLKQRQGKGPIREGDEVFLALLGMINRSIDDLEKLNKHEELRSQLESASNRITRDIFKYWRQNRKLKVQFLFEQGLPGDQPPFNAGWILRTRVENMRHGASTIFDQRSAGFVWFFSFLVWFSQIRKRIGDNVVILLDEPGLTLHASGQADLLRYIENELAQKYQVIYTTHSPFMIDPENLLRARTVEDVMVSHDDGEEEELGTKVGDQTLSTDRATLFPLQACLGYDLTQTLFVGKHTLLVEGPSDLLFFAWFDSKLRSLGRTGLDRRWTITPSGGITKVASFLSLFAGSKLDVAIVTDYGRGAKKTIDELKTSALLKAGRVLTLNAYAGQDEADIEDLIGRGMYQELVRGAYELGAEWSIPTERAAGAPIRILEELNAALPACIENLDHYRPAEWLTRTGLDYKHGGLEHALAGFERLFADLNQILPAKG